MILLIVAFTVAVFAYAFLRGDDAIRTAANVGAVLLAVTLVCQAIVGWRVVWPVIAADVCLGLALITLAAIYPRRWLYVEIVCCAALLMVHGFLLQDDALITPLYRLLNNGLVVAMAVILAGATFLNARAGAVHERA